MRKLGMPSTFIKMIRMLFHDAIIYFNINNKTTQPFGLHRGVQQGCPLAPYIFIITTNALNITVKYAMGTCNLKGINLSQSNSQQIIK